jgi:hypothetical protein
MRKAACGRCGFQIETATALKSRHTNAIYCSDITECDRRSRNKLTLPEMAEKNKGLLGGFSD